MTIDALGGGTALTSTLAGLTGTAKDRARVQQAEPAEAEKSQVAVAVKVEPSEKAAEDQPSTESKSIDDIAGDVAENARDSATTQLSILYDQDIDQFISRRVDPESGNVVRQFPYEEHLDRLRTLAELDGEDAEERLDLSV